MRRPLQVGVATAVTALLLAGATSVDASDGEVEAFRGRQNAAVEGILSVPSRRTAGPMPAVVILPDAFGPDRRADPYVESLAGLGVLVLEVDVHALAEVGGRRGSLTELAAAVAAVIGELALEPRVDARRIGVLGFGAGGRAALMAPPAADGTDPVAARAVLYPGCVGLARELSQSGIGVAAGTSAVLLVHGDNDAANPATTCAQLTDMLSRWVSVQREELAGAGYAWDRPAFAVEGPSLLPRPDGAGRVRSAARPDVAEQTATRVAAWLALALRSGDPAVDGR